MANAVIFESALFLLESLADFARLDAALTLLMDGAFGTNSALLFPHHFAVRNRDELAFVLHHERTFLLILDGAFLLLDGLAFTERLDGALIAVDGRALLFPDIIVDGFASFGFQIGNYGRSVIVLSLSRLVTMILAELMTKVLAELVIEAYNGRDQETKRN